MGGRNDGKSKNKRGQYERQGIERGGYNTKTSQKNQEKQTNFKTK